MSPASAALKKIAYTEAPAFPTRSPAQVVPLFNNEAIRKKQYERQCQMMAEELKNAPPIDDAPRSVQNQAARYTPAEEMTLANQAAMQGAKGFAFKL